MAVNTLNFGSKVVFVNGLPLTLPILAADPGSAVAGDMYFNSTSHLVKFYTGSAWQNVNDGGLANNVTASSNSTLVTLSALTTASSLASVGTITSGVWNGTAISTSFGGTGATSAAVGFANLSPMTTAGDLIYENNTPAPARLAIGSTGQVLTVVGGLPAWSGASAGTVTTVSVVTANGFAGTVANASSTPAITISTSINSPVLAGNGTAISAATTTGTGSTVVLNASPTFTGTAAFAAISATSASITGALNMNSHQINNVTDPSAAQDAATKNYVDNLINGLTWKGPVAAYASSNQALTGGTSLTIDGYSVQNGDFVILGAQTTAAQNYVYVASGIGTAYTLTQVVGSEAPTAVGDAYLIENGTAFGNTAFQVNAISPNVTFIQFAGPNTYSFTSPLLLTGNVVTIGFDNSTIGVTANQLVVKTNGITATQIANSTITYAKLQNESASTLLGNPSGSPAAPSEITLGATLAFVGSALQTIALSSDVTSSANSFATTVAKIQGTTVSGTTGSGNVVFSASPTLTGTIVAAAVNLSGALGANGGITSTGALTLNANAGASALQIEALNVQRSANGTNFITETYVDSTTLTDNSGPTTVTAFNFAVASFAGIEITYAVESGDSNADCRVGTLRVTANSSGTITPSIADMYSESADCGVSWSAVNSSGTINVQYTTSNQGANRTMRADVKFIRR